MFTYVYVYVYVYVYTYTYMYMNYFCAFIFKIPSRGFYIDCSFNTWNAISTCEIQDIDDFAKSF